MINDPSSSQFEDEVSRHARTDLTLVGIVGIVDPPRDEIPYVVKTLRGAGIRIFMVRFRIALKSAY
jgi:sodium/potassium-transporting ATPase subunit alpha